MKQLARLLRMPPPVAEAVALDLVTAEVAQSLAEPFDPAAPVGEAQASAVAAIIDILRQRIARIEAATQLATPKSRTISA